VEEIIQWIFHSERTEGVTFSGGEPFLQAKALCEVAIPVKQDGKSIVIFTGFTHPEILESEDIIITPDSCLPTELKQDVVILEPAKPDTELMENLLENTSGNIGALKGVAPELRSKIIETSLGLSSTQAERVFKKAVVMSKNGVLSQSCIDVITEEKRQIIRRKGRVWNEGTAGYDSPSRRY
jgi:hypothetical protein